MNSNCKSPPSYTHDYKRTEKISSAEESLNAGCCELFPFFGGASKEESFLDVFQRCNEMML
jgi:hypothetical protein